MIQSHTAFLIGSAPLELWGGVECTINRIGELYRDQADETGHASRLSDVDLIAGIGLKAIRYPLLWEQISPDRPSEHNWAWHDERLSRLHEHGQRIIAGLVHHGSGPRYTDLLDDGFATGLADHATAVAGRYPFIMDWTPVNEPVTTARFSALYGHWYPHRRDERSFWLALLNQVDATRLSMRAIRRLIPGARLIQTDDLGRTYATAALRDQAGFDNVRRWMGWDLLCGMVTPGHDLWKWLCTFGLEPHMRRIADDPCPPDIIGINHYLTSDRFLDHRRQPPRRHGPDMPDEPAFADIEAIRILHPAPQGLAGALREAWSRYRVPLAITEVHNGCTREEQMRWMSAAWSIANEARACGIDVRAVTAWALFGNSGWDTLLTRPGHQEAGAYQPGEGTPSPTAMLPLLQNLAAGTVPQHPVLAGDGWWQRPIRFQHRPLHRAATMRLLRHRLSGRQGGPPLLIAGASGTLGRALAAACEHRDISYVALGRAEMDVLDEASVAAALDRHQPWAVINAAGWVRVDDAEDHEAACMALNADGAGRIAIACDTRGIQSVHISSDLIFDGSLQRAYDETDSPCPINAYGRSKAAAERKIGALAGRHLIVRTAAFFSPFDRHNFAAHVCKTLLENQWLIASDKHVVSPTYVPDLCDAILDLAIDEAVGIRHLTNGEACSWGDFARDLANAAGLDAGLIVPGDDLQLGWRAPRPVNVPLATRHGRLMPSLADAIARFIRDWRPESMADAIPEPVSDKDKMCL